MKVFQINSVAHSYFTNYAIKCDLNTVKSY